MSGESLSIQFVHKFKARPLQFYHPYRNTLGDSLIISRFEYYVSNIKLIADSSVWQSREYFFVKQLRDSSHILSIDLQNIPSRPYRWVELSIGVDSLKNHSGAQVGALDPINGMFWTWNQGYIFLKLEGYYLLPQPPNRGMVYHIGEDNCYQTLRFELPEGWQVAQGLRLAVELDKLFGGFEQAPIRLKMPQSQKSISVMGGPKAPKIAENYRYMFTFEGLRK